MIPVPAYFVMVLGSADPTSFNPEENLAMLLAAIMPVLVFIYAILTVLAIFLRAFLASRLRNYVFSETELDDVAALRSTTSTGGLFMVYFINLLLVVFSFGLALP